MYLTVNRDCFVFVSDRLNLECHTKLTIFAILFVSMIKFYQSKCLIQGSDKKYMAGHLTPTWLPSCSDPIVVARRDTAKKLTINLIFYLLDCVLYLLFNTPFLFENIIVLSQF